ncbi:MAG: response regulator [Gammaproteobacteria bacterium]|nr:response regulator [Gammaproteobacteria bacterium]
MTDKKPSIVVVDDSSTSISLYQFSLEPLSVEFQGFQSPKEALSYLAEHKPALLFLDIVMPGMDGLTFLQRLRTFPNQKDTPVIMVTSKDYAQDRIIAKQFGALDFLIKPLRFQEIRELVYKHTGIKLLKSGTRKP